jgi:hypothetical protein
MWRITNFFRSLVERFRNRKIKARALKQAKKAAARRICENCRYGRRTYCVRLPAAPFPGLLGASQYPVIGAYESCEHFQYGRR